MAELDWGHEVKPRPHSGRVGIDKVLKDARRGDLRAVKEHLRRDPRSEIVVLLKPYCIAVRYRRAELAEMLLEAGTEIDIYSACFLGDVQRVRALLEKDLSALKREQEDDSVWRVTPLHHAVAGGHEKLTRSLIEAGAEVAAYTRLLCNATVRMGHPELLPVLLDGGADRELARVWAAP